MQGQLYIDSGSSFYQNYWINKILYLVITEISYSNYRGDTCDVDHELQGMLNFAQKNNTKRLTGFKETITAVMSPSSLKPFGILFTYFMIYQWGGVNTITFYAVQVFKVRKLFHYIASSIIS